MMTPERWRQVDGVLQQAQELEGDALRRFLDAACAGDEELRREVESLLAAERAEDNFLSQPVMEVAAGIIANNSTGRETAQQYDDQLPSNAPTLIKAGQDDGQLRLGLMQGVLLDGRYLIERELGRGGIGVVFLAQDQRLSGKRVVIKVLLEHWLKTDNRLWFERKFREEIKALALIDHPGVVPALDVGQLPDGRSYLVMQFVAGEPLSQSISPSGIALKRAANLIHQIALALYAAHEKGVIHRDLKPDNILLQTVDGEERIKLIDFGIATVRDAIGTGSSSTTVVAGTPRYMAPEQLQGKPEKASDTYALGVIIYQLVTGQLPFNSKTLTEIAAEQRAGIKVRPRDLHPDLPEAAERAILKALAIDPANRYQDAREFGNQFRQAIEAVDPFQTNIGVSLQEDAPVYSDAPPTQRFPSRRRFLISAATLLAMLLLGALAWRGLRFDRTDSGNNPPVNPKPTLPAVTERTVSYSFWLKRAAHPRNVEPVLSRDLIGGPRDEFRINVSSPQAGYLYLINERPTPTQKFDVMFPAGGSAEMRAGQVLQIPPPSGQPENDWFGFEREGDTDKIWLIWSAHEVPELEAVKHWANAEDDGKIKNREEVETLRRYLAAQSANVPTIEADEATKQTKLTGKGPVLVGSITLRHR